MTCLKGWTSEDYSNDILLYWLNYKEEICGFQKVNMEHCDGGIVVSIAAFQKVNMDHNNSKSSDFEDG